jgi:hypothetical protein
MTEHHQSIMDTLRQFYDNLGGFLCPPATTEQVTFTEQQLGVSLLEPLRRYYLELANGGFGPSYGVLGVHGGYEGAMGTIDSALGNLFDLDVGDLEATLLLNETTTTSLEHHTFRVLTHVDLVDHGCCMCDEMNLQTGRIYQTDVTANDEISIRFIAEDMDAYLAMWLTRIDDRYREDYRMMRHLHSENLAYHRSENAS